VDRPAERIDQGEGMAEISVTVKSDKGTTTVTILHDDEMAALGEAIGVLIATRGAGLPEALATARAVLEAFAPAGGENR
jgi:hypothetical protein